MIKLDIQKSLRSQEGEMQLHLSLEMEKGELLTLYGPSGAGKTSTLKMIAGLMIPDEGHIIVNGKPWFDKEHRIHLPPKDRNIGFVFQDYALFPNMTIIENLQFASTDKQSQAYIKELLEITDLSSLSNRKPHQLSGGQQQRTALARALVQRPQILLLDEPLSALDKGIRSKLQAYILRVHKEYNLTTLLISHDIHEILRMSDRVVEMAEGKIITKGHKWENLINKEQSDRFQFVGEVIEISHDGKGHFAKILIGSNIVILNVSSNKAATLKLGDTLILSTDQFDPEIVKKI